MKSLNTIIKIVSFIIVPVGVLLFCNSYFLLDEPLAESVVSAVAAMTGMIPEGLVLPYQRRACCRCCEACGT